MWDDEAGNARSKRFSHVTSGYDKIVMRPGGVQMGSPEGADEGVTVVVVVVVDYDYHTSLSL